MSFLVRDFAAFWLSCTVTGFCVRSGVFLSLSDVMIPKISGRAFVARELDFIFVIMRADKCDILVCDFPTFWLSCPVPRFRERSGYVRACHT